MDSRLISLCKELAKMTSDQAAAWILSRYPLASDNWGEALLLLPHRSWKKPEQKRLADYFLRKFRSLALEDMKRSRQLCQLS